jgi:hypothetical protein
VSSQFFGAPIAAVLHSLPAAPLHRMVSIDVTEKSTEVFAPLAMSVPDCRDGCGNVENFSQEDNPSRAPIIAILGIVELAQTTNSDNLPQLAEKRHDGATGRDEVGLDRRWKCPNSFREAA